MISTIPFNRFKWQTIVSLVLGFWISACLFMDVLVMPEMYASGMMTDPGFASAGYSMFWVFNRVELLCAAIALTGVLVLSQVPSAKRFASRRCIVLTGLLLSIALVDTYGLAPAMSELGMQLNLFATTVVPTTMDSMHSSYFVLELLKVGAAVLVLTSCYRAQSSDRNCVS